MLSFRNNVGHHVLVSGNIFPGHDHNLSNGFVLPQHGFNLPQLDPESSDLYLMVDAAEKLDITVRAVPDKVTCLVEAGARFLAEGVWNKLLRRQVRTVQVTPRQAVTPRIQFPRHTNRHKLEMLVKNVYLRVGYGPSDGDRCRIPGQPLRDGVTTGECGVFRRAVTVYDLCPGQSLLRTSHMGCRKLFPSDQ